MNLLFLVIFGSLGVLARYGLDHLSATRYSGLFPLSTFSINILGSFLIGFAYVAGQELQLLSQPLRLALITGFLGGFTTFSSFSLQGFRLLEQAQYTAAMLYLVLSPILGLAAAGIGIYSARSIL